MDLEIIARHIQLLSKLLSVESLPEGFKKAGKRIPAQAFTTGGGEEISLEGAKSITREHLISKYHPMGSCMTALRKEGSAVGEALRVYGMRGLRVVDASAFLVVPRGNNITSVYATAEKASNLTKEDWRERWGCVHLQSE
jgi:choline dehydrogenase-like flavoprotein